MFGFRPTFPFNRAFADPAKVMLRYSILSLLLFGAATFFVGCSGGSGGFEEAYNDGDGYTWVKPEYSASTNNYGKIEEFLTLAQVVSVEQIPRGITKPKRLLLEHNGERSYAIFRDVDIFQKQWQSAEGLKLNYHDSCLFECASYRLSRLLGLYRVPPVVQRKFEPKDFQNAEEVTRLERLEGSLQIWIPEAMTEKDRRDKELQPPPESNWEYQQQVMLIFDNLIFNDDRNLGNILISADWKIWFIDSTRAFRPIRNLRNPEAITHCERELWKRLQEVDAPALRTELGDLLNDAEFNTLINRKEELIQHIRGLIKDRGEDKVLFTL